MTGHPRPGGETPFARDHPRSRRREGRCTRSKCVQRSEWAWDEYGRPTGRRRTDRATSARQTAARTERRTHLGAELRARLNAAGISQASVASAAGVSMSAVSSRARRPPHSGSGGSRRRAVAGVAGAAMTAVLTPDERRLSMRRRNACAVGHADITAGGLCSKASSCSPACAPLKPGDHRADDSRRSGRRSRAPCSGEETDAQTGAKLLWPARTGY